MTVEMPTSLADVVTALAERPGATLLAGGTDLMVEVNEGHRSIGQFGSSDHVIGLTRVPELTSFTVDRSTGTVTLGSGVRWCEIEREPLRSLLPALAQAARTVGSPQIRNAGTVGGNLATCSPAGDGLPVLAATGAVVHLLGPDGARDLAVTDFMTGVKRTAKAPGELITAVTVPLLTGWQGYSKVGVRNAMVIATASACVATDVPSRSVRIALGSVGPTIIRCTEAEGAAERAVDWDTRADPPSITIDGARHCARMAAAASRPIDDHRSTADYRRRAVAVMVERLLLRAFPGEVPR